MSFRRAQVLVIGDLLLDYQYWVEKFPRAGGDEPILGWRKSLGGSAANTAVTLASLGVPCLFCGMLGEDEAAGEISAQLESMGIDTSHIQFGISTGYTVTMIDASGERTMFSYRGASARAPEFTPRLAGALTDAAVLFLSGYYLLQAKQARFVLKAAELAKASGGLVALDPSPMIGSVAAEVLEPLLAVTDFIFPNKRELRLLTGVGDEERGIGALLERTKNIVLKLGGGGSRLALRTPAGVRMFAAPAVQVAAVDTTGAGDVFNGGFIAAYLEGGTPSEWLERANALAAQAIGRKGATSLFFK